MTKQEATLLLAQAKSALKASFPKKSIIYVKKAVKLEPDWLPCILIYVETLIVLGKNNSAIRLIEKTWKKEPHDQLVPLYKWAYHKEKPINFYKKLIKLTRYNKKNKTSLMALAKGAIKADLWGEARRLLMYIVHSNNATKSTYLLLSKLEQRESHNDKKAAKWIEKAVQTPADPSWYCTLCGSNHEYWEACCLDCGKFNSLDWYQSGQSHKKVTSITNNLITDYLS
jgi:HemY protein